MRTFIYFILYLLFGLVFFCMLIAGLDMELARRDYNKAVESRDFEKPIIGCIFEQVCNLYTERLFRK